jgi:poly-gamma-glutamate capsule biosynthesis protein CapA/YwtB (metallophosphatase superfamily)
MPQIIDHPPVTLAFAGDVMLGRLVNESLDPANPARPWGDLLPLMKAAELTFVNLECALTARTARWTDGGFKPFYFRATPAAAVATLVAGDVDFVSVANNHIGDYGSDGLLDTLAALDRAGIAHAGAGIDRWSACEPVPLTTDGLRVSVVAFADYPVEWRAGPTTPGINYTPISLALEDFDEVAHQLAVARERADLVVCSIHWGPNMRAWPTSEFRAFAHAVIDGGADLFWGHSAHVAQGVEFRRGRPILYDTGDLLDDYAVDAHLRNDLSALFLVHLRPPLVENVEIVPVQIEDLQVNLARGQARDWFLERFTARCAEFDAVVVSNEPGRLRVTAPGRVAGAGTQAGR